MGKGMDFSCLSRVKRPSRYLGCELNANRHPAHPTDLHVVTAFPDLYEVGMSHIGLGILYNCLNREPGVHAERVFLPDTDLQDLLRHENAPLCTLETGTPLNKIDLLGFTLAYELTYTNVLAMLDLGGTPPAFLSQRPRAPSGYCRRALRVQPGTPERLCRCLCDR